MREAEVAARDPEMDHLENPGKTLPCNGCGLCCQEEVCQIGQLVFAPEDDDRWIEGPCPALVFSRGRYWCGLVLVESSKPVPKLLAKTLGIGMGCCANDPGP